MKIALKFPLFVAAMGTALVATAVGAATIRYRVEADPHARKSSVACMESSTNECVFRIGDPKATGSETVHVKVGDKLGLPEADFELQYCADVAEGERLAWPSCAEGPTAGLLSRSTTIDYRFF